MTMPFRCLGLLTFLLSAGCVNRPPDNLCADQSALSLNPLPPCRLVALSNAIAQVEILDWQEARAYSFEGLPDQRMTPVQARVVEAQKGVLGADFELLVASGVDDGGVSENGPLRASDGGVQPGVVFLSSVGGHWVMLAGGWYWRDGSELRSLRLPDAGVLEAEFVGEIRKWVPKGGCSEDGGCL